MADRSGKETTCISLKVLNNVIVCVASYSKERGEEERKRVWEEGREESGEGEREEGRNGKGGRKERKRGINGYQQK